MTLKSICKALQHKGLDANIRPLYDNGVFNGRICVWVEHDYYGIYPDDKAFNAHVTARNLARKHGYSAEKRGYCQATMIYEEV